MGVIQDLKMILSNATTTCITNAKTYTEEKARYRAVVDFVNQLEADDCGREYVKRTGRCPICTDCPHNCPLENKDVEKIGE